MDILVESTIVRRVIVDAKDNAEAIEKSSELFTQSDVVNVEGVEVKYTEPHIICSYPVVEYIPTIIPKARLK